MNQQPTLEFVAGQFTSWRETRQNRREPIPAFLKQQAIALKNNYKTNDIRIALGISGSNLKHWAEEQAEKESASFVALPLTEVITKHVSEPSQVICQFPNGIKIFASNSPLNSDLLALLFSLTMEA